MRPAETIANLAAFSGRGAGTDAERRAALWLADALQTDARKAQLEPFWSRPNGALGHAWHAALGVAGSLLAIASPPAGAALLGIVLLSTIADALSGRSLGRLLTPERASQNVVSEPELRSAPGEDAVHLILTANYDAGRTGLASDQRFALLAARAARAAGGLALGWLGWLCVALAWLLIVAALRAGGSAGTTLDVLQLIPTVALLLAFALLLERATSRFGPAANDNASGVAAVVALARALDAAPPRHMRVDVVLQGASDGDGGGLRRYLHAHDEDRHRHNTVVLAFAASGAGDTRWWSGDGALVPLAYSQQLRSMCAELAAEEAGLAAAEHRGRGTTSAFAARLRGLPAITLGALDGRGVAPRSHRPDDLPEAVQESTIDAVVEFALLIVDRLDGHLARRQPATARA